MYACLPLLCTVCTYKGCEDDIITNGWGLQANGARLTMLIHKHGHDVPRFLGVSSCYLSSRELDTTDTALLALCIPLYIIVLLSNPFVFFCILLYSPVYYCITL